jgi:hypothetical protein
MKINPSIRERTVAAGGRLNGRHQTWREGRW